MKLLSLGIFACLVHLTLEADFLSPTPSQRPASTRCAPKCETILADDSTTMCDANGKNCINFMGWGSRGGACNEDCNTERCQYDNGNCKPLTTAPNFNAAGRKNITLLNNFDAGISASVKSVGVWCSFLVMSISLLCNPFELF